VKINDAGWMCDPHLGNGCLRTMESTGVINRIARTMTAAPLDEIERRLCGDQISSPDVGFGCAP